VALVLCRLGQCSGHFAGKAAWERISGIGREVRVISEHSAKPTYPPPRKHRISPIDSLLPPTLIGRLIKELVLLAKSRGFVSVKYLTSIHAVANPRLSRSHFIFLHFAVPGSLFPADTELTQSHNCSARRYTRVCQPLNQSMDQSTNLRAQPAPKGIQISCQSLNRQLRRISLVNHKSSLIRFSVKLGVIVGVMSENRLSGIQSHRIASGGAFRG
jgi:hypothetical protein